jgi:tetratricopeptide (TPR) repeat protein
MTSKTPSSPDIESRLQRLRESLLDAGATAPEALEQLRWIIETRPDFSQVAQRKNAVNMLSRAVRGLVLSEPLLAEKCLSYAIELDPADKELKTQLFRFYSLFDARSNQPAASGVTGEFVQRDLQASRFYHLTRMPAVAFEAGKLDQAITAAEELLTLSQEFKDDPNFGNAVNQAHTVLGRVALKMGDTPGAINQLNLSAIENTNPQTLFVESSLDLARDLLKAGKTDHVVDYLDQFERLFGCGNESAFQLRYESQHGELNRDDFESLQKFLEAFFQHQLSALKTLPPDKRQEELKRLIDSERTAFDILEHELEEANKESAPKEQIMLLEKQLFMCKEHVKQLEAVDRV